MKDALSPEQRDFVESVRGDSKSDVVLEALLSIVDRTAPKPPPPPAPLTDDEMIAVLTRVGYAINNDGLLAEIESVRSSLMRRSAAVLEAVLEASARMDTER